MASSSVLAADEILTAFLDRLVQEVFRIGMRLRANTEERVAAREAQRLVAQLGVVVEDIRDSLMAWQFGVNQLAPDPIKEALPFSGDRENDAERVAPYLRVASEALQRPGGNGIVPTDGGEWIALDHAVHHLHASIAALQNIWPDGAA